MHSSLRLRGLIRLQVQINPDTSCWEWQGQIANSGHGRMMISDAQGRRTVSAAQASFIAHHEELPPGVRVRQTCGNRLCVNPDHLQAEYDQSPQAEVLQ
ncbi:MAG: HNH endonuclease [Gammaproteobacteria bacterium SHHR-1]|uniref:hypothetical protein n=1 Tax=Magnetovirga frankeli TaxID=947516 RepID=UPI001292FB6E|nr:hypothetical protein D5125_06795 [gamma proteobacterium SS-5]